MIDSSISSDMSIRRSFNSSNMRTALLLISNRIRNPSPNQLANASIYKQSYGFSSMNHQGLRLLTVSRGIHSDSDSPLLKKDEEDKDHQAAVPHDQPPVSPPASKFNFPSWAKWALGSILTILLPFWKQKWENLKKIEGEVEVIEEEIEKVAEVVEKVADVAEKVSENVANNIPNDGPFKEAALVAELISKGVANEAHITQEIIHTVDELKEEVEELIDPLGTKGKDANQHK
ncbi:hypothetical protein NE237_017120 [Protea cynaroides]|uniref:Uncharacterized protein n=1 Tax=Protea cynaroides TaxID=273540 RepID=A0A9Q0K7G7_9MAGN|nr:hypothetical protein NE237_017120 [Protea cynaroides]